MKPKSERILAAYEGTLQAPIRYAIETLLSLMGLPHEVTTYEALGKAQHATVRGLMAYGRRPPTSQPRVPGLWLQESDFFRRMKARDYDPSSIRPRYFGQVPVLFLGEGSTEPWVKQNRNRIETSIDVIASSFFLLSRWEERFVPTRDEYGRFPATASLAVQHGFLQTPVVNLYVGLLWQWWKRVLPGLEQRSLWPAKKDFAVCLTHDIDRVHLGSSLAGGRLPGLRRKLTRSPQVKRLVKGLMKWRALGPSGNRLRNFEEITEGEVRFGFQSSFYFIAGGRNPNDGDYDLDDGEINRVMRELTERGFEVGLHGSFDSYLDRHQLRREYDRLRGKGIEVLGGRQHYLRFDVEQTLGIQEEVGLKYDCTMGFADREGYRSGLASPYYPYSFVREAAFQVLEIPLVVMDRTLSGRRYRDLSSEQGWRYLKRILEETRRIGGCIALLWHNNTLDATSNPDWAGVYWKALGWIHDHHGWGTSGKEIFKWWSAQHSLRQPGGQP